MRCFLPWICAFINSFMFFGLDNVLLADSSFLVNIAFMLIYYCAFSRLFLLVTWSVLYILWNFLVKYQTGKWFYLMWFFLRHINFPIFRMMLWSTSPFHLFFKNNDIICSYPKKQKGETHCFNFSKLYMISDVVKKLRFKRKLVYSKLRNTSFKYF